MTTESNESQNRFIDRLSNQWLDTEPGDSEFYVSAMIASESLNSGSSFSVQQMSSLYMLCSQVLLKTMRMPGNTVSTS